MRSDPPLVMVEARFTRAAVQVIEGGFNAQHVRCSAQLRALALRRASSHGPAMVTKLDHILFGVPDLEAGTALFTELTGVQPVTGGSHPGFGTRNRLVSLAPDVFFELIAPDPEQEIKGKPRAESIAALPWPRLLTFAIQTTDLDTTICVAQQVGLASGAPVAMSRTRPDGVRLDWSVAHLSLAGYDAVIPFAIDWQGRCSIKSFTVLHPAPERLREIYGGLGVDIAVQTGTQGGFVLVLDTPKGEVCFLG
jgi:hypothetical protein